jgi:hypothetical protein
LGVVGRSGQDRQWALAARSIVGRGADCAVRIDDRLVSGEHAALTWRDGQWQLRDLASRNGTFVAGRRLAPGERVPLSLGSRFAVGGEDLVLELVDATGPGASAVRADGTRVTADGGVLLLPDADVAAVAVYTDENASWWVEDADGEARPAVDGEVVSVADGAWTLSLPRELPPTMAARAEDLRAHFRVSLDEEHAELKITRGASEHSLPPRSFTYMLLTLGRRRLADQEQGLSDREQGWMTQDELAGDLRLDQSTVGVYVHRARRQAGRIGDGVARAIIERRRGTRQLRLGLPVGGIDRG